MLYAIATALFIASIGLCMYWLLPRRKTITADFYSLLGFGLAQVSLLVAVALITIKLCSHFF